eukprot:TRINITY_DN7730_c0_g1_i1.p1 TRINITY_DN7730_c0_g1~~TRINITY_DN7730_c0_g1_i1.p1  ORF type:complete len:460 (+),score=64.84 TRINITY_DN7730_c0_g1_i1:82-1461(+)
MGAVTLLAWSVLSSTEVHCPSEYEAITGECLKYFQDPKGWYSAEVACQREGGHLMELRSKEQLDMLSESYRGPSVWLGLTGESGEWRFSSNDLIDAALLQSFNTELKDPIPGSHCAVLTDKGVVLDKCLSNHVHFCQVGVNSCNWHSIAVLEFDSGSDHYTLTRNNIVTKNSEEIGIGEWYSHNTFRLAATSSTVNCNWVVRFISSSEVECGCDGSLTAAKWNPAPPCSGAFEKGSVSDFEEGDGKQIQDTGPRTPLTPTGPGVNGPNEEVLDVKQPTNSQQKESSDSSPPLWMWPLAFVAVAGVSTVAAFGVLKSKKRNSQDSGSGDDGPLGHQMMPIPGEPKPKPSRPCDICRKFNESTARQRLQSVHDALTKELSMPLVVSGTRCDHVGGEHIHVFNVENEFDSHTLGALSTVYSRTKPRLPRNTRIHILHKKERQKLQDGSDFAADHVYIADAYY